MIRRFILLLIALFCCLQMKAQENYKPPATLYEDNEFALGVSGLYFEAPEFATRIGYGLTLNASIHENVALSWHLYFGNRYFSTSMWAPLGPLLMATNILSGNNARYSLGLLLLSLLPDGVCFPLRLSDNFFIAPSISPFWLDLFGKDQAYKRFYISGNIGIGFYLKTKHFNIHPFGAAHLIYKSKPNIGYSGGFGIEIPLSKL